MAIRILLSAVNEVLGSYSLLRPIPSVRAVGIVLAWYSEYYRQDLRRLSRIFFLCLFVQYLDHSILCKMKAS